MLGNLIYQAEMGRSDMKNFFRWLTRHATDDPTTLDRIRAEEAAGDGARPLAEAFVQETLRTDQSRAGAIRIAKRDIVFDGFLIIPARDDPTVPVGVPSCGVRVC